MKHNLFSSIAERVTPRLAHANAAVVLSAVKVSLLLVILHADLSLCKCLFKLKFLWIKNVQNSEI